MNVFVKVCMYTNAPVQQPFLFFVLFLQIDIFMNGHHVETFEEDLSFTSDATVLPDVPQIQDELKGPIAYCLTFPLASSVTCI